MISSAGIAHLRDLPLTRLGLSSCKGLSNRGLASLRNMKTLTDLGLGYCGWLRDEGLGRLRALPLRRLVVICCSKLTNKGLKTVEGMPLTSLDLRGSLWLTDDGLGHLRKLPLTELDLVACFKVTDAGMEYLARMTLTRLNLEACSKVSDECRKRLHRWDEGKSWDQLPVAPTIPTAGCRGCFFIWSRWGKKSEGFLTDEEERITNSEFTNSCALLSASLAALVLRNGLFMFCWGAQ